MNRRRSSFSIKKESLIILICISLITLLGCEKESDRESMVVTLDISNLSPSSANGNGTIVNQGSFTVFKKGLCWGLKPLPTVKNFVAEAGSGPGSFNCEINSLLADSTYYLRAFALNQNDTLYGNQIEFKTPDFIVFNPQIKYGSLTDIDGNEYRTVTIGSQTWMAENLRTTHYRNGDPVLLETDPKKWGFFNITTGAYCWFRNDISKKEVHGAFYNWYAASDTRNIAPEGWHVSTDEDWEKLKTYLNPYSSASYAYQLFEANDAHSVGSLYYKPDNRTGFTAIPSGKLAISPFSFTHAGFYAYYWTSKGGFDGSTGIYVGREISISSLEYNCLGFNIRCVKD